MSLPLTLPGQAHIKCQSTTASTVLCSLSHTIDVFYTDVSGRGAGIYWWAAFSSILQSFCSFLGTYILNWSYILNTLAVTSVLLCPMTSYIPNRSQEFEELAFASELDMHQTGSVSWHPSWLPCDGSWSTMGLSCLDCNIDFSRLYILT